MKKQSRIQAHHLHFAHGWIWGVVAVLLGLLVYAGIAKGYFHYWFGEEFRIVNAHEVVQSENEAEKLEDVMRKTGVKTTVLVGMPSEALYYTGEQGFTGYKENNEAILEVQKENPVQFEAFCTLDPSDPNVMDVVQWCVEKGTKGFKLYSGHTFFYDKDLPLNDEKLDPMYSYFEFNQLPLIFHVNTGEYLSEFEDVLTEFPDMTVVCPHFCLSSKNLQRLSYLFDHYPKLYVDLSWGDEPLLVEGFTRISEDPEKYREFITKYADRFLFGTDTVVTDYEGKDEAWLTNLFTLYRDLLEKEETTIFYEESGTVYKTLHLDYPVLEKIYETNWKKVMGESEESLIQAFLLKF
ncbi:MAG: Amidohydrolase 2 [uncultured bacterium]|nr:MAG: Amidohydrolase 2 [uncultured bacterium]